MILLSAGFGHLSAACTRSRRAVPGGAGCSLVRCFPTWALKRSPPLPSRDTHCFRSAARLALTLRHQTRCCLASDSKASCAALPGSHAAWGSRSRAAKLRGWLQRQAMRDGSPREQNDHPRASIPPPVSASPVGSWPGLSGGGRSRSPGGQRFRSPLSTRHRRVERRVGGRHPPRPQVTRSAPPRGSPSLCWSPGSGRRIPTCACRSPWAKDTPDKIRLWHFFSIKPSSTTNGEPGRRGSWAIVQNACSIFCKGHGRTSSPATF